MVKKAEEGKKQQTLGSKEVASMLGVDAKFLRQVLRSGKRNGDKHTRYEWEQNDPALKKQIPEMIAKYKEDRKKKKTALPPKKKAAAKKSAPEAGKPKAKLPAKKAVAKKAQPKPKPEPETDSPLDSEAIETI